MTKTKIYVYPADLWACGHYRMIWPAQAIAEQYQDDVEIVIAGIGDDVADELKLSGRTDNQGRLIDINYPKDADVIVLQRPTHRFLAQGVVLMRKAGIDVIIDMDDDLSKIHPSNPAFSHLHPKMGNPDHSWKHVEHACLHATWVTASTEGVLKKYAPHGRGSVLTNAVPAHYLDVPRTDDGAVTWCGSLHSHPDDLRQVGTSFLELHRAGVRVGVVGGGEGVERELGLPLGSLEVSGIIPIEDWHKAVSQSLATVAPLADTHFNSCKSWLKPLEAMAVGVPVVVSPGREYAKLVEKTGAGLVASKPKHFAGALKRLASSAELRAEQSALGREAVAKSHTIEGEAWRWAEVWATTSVTTSGTMAAVG